MRRPSPRVTCSRTSPAAGDALHEHVDAEAEPLAAFVARLKDEYSPTRRACVLTVVPGYDVLGRMLEVQCNQPFATCMQERLLAPLGMQRSTFDVERAERALLATHYWSEKPVASVAVRDVPAAGLISNVPELARFMQMLLANGKLAGSRY